MGGTDYKVVRVGGSLWPEASSSVRLHGTLSGSCALWQPLLHNATLTWCPALFSCDHECGENCDPGSRNPVPLVSVSSSKRDSRLPRALYTVQKPLQSASMWPTRQDRERKLGSHTPSGPCFSDNVQGWKRRERGSRRASIRRQMGRSGEHTYVS